MNLLTWATAAPSSIRRHVLGIGAHRLDLIACSLLALVAISIFSIRLSLPSVLDDRGFYLHGAWVLDAVQNGNWICPQNHAGDLTSKPPLYIWLAALATLPFARISLFTMMLPGAIATLGVAAAIWVFGREAFGKSAGLLGALAYLLSYSGATQIALARPDGVFALTVTMGALAAFRAWTSGQGWTWFWLFAAAATLAKGPVGLLLAALGLLAVAWERWSGQVAPIRGSHRWGIVLFLVITGGWFGLAYLQYGQALVDRMVFRELFRHAIGEGDGSGPSHPVYIQPVNFLLGLAPWSLFACIGFWRIWKHPASNPGERRAERFLFCWFFAGLLLFTLASHRQARLLFPIIPAAALVAGREMARWAANMRPRALLATGAMLTVVGMSAIAVSYHLIRDDSQRVARAQGMRELALSIRERVGDGFPITHVDTPFSLQFFLNSTTPLATAQRAASVLSGPGVAFVAVRDLDSLRIALAQTSTPLYVVAQWPAAGEAYVSVVSNHARLEWTDDLQVPHRRGAR
jgi:4-amino-4-deoxy-L-arabinose transferase-like glycosyltransferase